ncbi:Antirestriction protein [Chryseobacterium taklimakanense]|uniref:Antirestriction protein n=1 Tax=Chryseobacterium taklimakanense TaxID=536441 RepID=A0A239X493_9FLAO|nr:antirestriction protein ArdA [Chryseobacterium taklimakanense]SNV41472.1 Antirestriction protein [Chryseobacterium taklimakanense]
MANLSIFLDEIQVYVGTYKKYSEGSIFGKWLLLSDYSDFQDFHEAIKELHSDEDDPEYMYQDYEISPLFERMGLISECHISSQIFEVIEAIKSSSYDLEVWEAFTDCFGTYEDVSELEQKIQDSYMGEYGSDEEFAEQLLIETDSIPRNLPSYIYIDWERTARDLMMDYSASNGHYFRCF